MQAEAARAYDEALTESLQRSPSPEYAALDLMDFRLLGGLQVLRGETGLFRAGSGVAVAPDMPVLRVLLGLREAVILATADGPQTMFCADETWVSVRKDGEHLRLTSSRSLLAAEPEWLEAISNALSQLRSWLSEFTPATRADPLLGPWLRGGAPPAFSGPLPQRGLIA